MHAYVLDEFHQNTNTPQIDRRRLLVGASMAAAMTVLTACTTTRETQSITKGKPTFIDVVLASAPAEFGFGPSLSEAGFENAAAAEEGAKNIEVELTKEVLLFTGKFSVSHDDFIVGQAKAKFSDGTTGQVSAKDHVITAQYNDSVVALSESFGDNVKINGKLVDQETAFASLREKSGSKGIANLSDLDRALLIYAGLLATPAMTENMEQAQLYAVSIDWCYWTARAGAVALVALGITACVALLAGCASGGVAIPGLGQVGCFALGVLCRALAGSFALLVEALKRFLWNTEDIA